MLLNLVVPQALRIPRFNAYEGLMAPWRSGYAEECKSSHPRFKSEAGPLVPPSSNVERAPPAFVKFRSGQQLIRGNRTASEARRL